MIYLDHAATTPVRREALDAMLPYLTDCCGNPSSSYHYAFSARDALKKARSQAAALIGVPPESVFFTSGGTESDNWALIGAARSLSAKGKHIITSSIEHHAILHTADYLESQGFEITRLPVSTEGLVSPKDLEAAIRPDTILVSVMTANNEIGTIQPISRLAETAHRHGLLFHTDAVQAFGQIPLSAEKMGFDLLSASSHKLYGPKGVGCLYIREGSGISPLIFGGGQEKGMRSGTENIPGIAGFGAACEAAAREMKDTMAKETRLRDALIRQVLDTIPGSSVNGSLTDRLPGNISFSFSGIEGTSLLVLLDMYGICASAGSACSAASTAPSHVLKAIGLSDRLIRGTLRLTLGRSTSEEEIQTVWEVLSNTVGQLRRIREEESSGCVHF